MKLAAILRSTLLVAGLSLCVLAAQAQTFTDTGTVGGLAVSGTATFNLVAKTITLTNTTAGGTPTNAQNLVGVLFDIAGSTGVGLTHTQASGGRTGDDLSTTGMFTTFGSVSLDDISGFTHSSASTKAFDFESG